MKKLLLTLPICLLAGILSAQHVVTLRSGEKLNGQVRSLNAGTLDFFTKGNAMQIKIDDIYSINFVEQASVAGGPSTAIAPLEVGEKQVMAGNYLVRYKVSDRKIVTAPKVANMTQKKGTVVVDIVIDKYGHVRKAVPRASGTTTNDAYLNQKAVQAAESAIFDNVPTAPTEQSGYMIVTF
ncbi:MAG: hypothetical protein ACKO1U_09815 [Bacteroidota bacterium]